VSKLTGERPLVGITPDSLLALHSAGYRAVRERLGPGRMLDVGCGQGFETVQFAGTDRSVTGVDYSFEAAADATARYGPTGLRVAQCDARRLSLGTGTFDWPAPPTSSSTSPTPRPTVPSWPACCRPKGRPSSSPPTPQPTSRTPSTSASSAEPSWYRSSSVPSTTSGWAGIDAVPHVKEDFRLRREKAKKVLRLDVFDIRHKIPHSWYVGPTPGLSRSPIASWPGRHWRRHRDHRRRLLRHRGCRRDDPRPVGRGRQAPPFPMRPRSL